MPLLNVASLEHLTDSVIVITGGTSGIGLALAERLISLSGRVRGVVVCSRSQAGVDKAVKQLNDDRAYGMTCDVTSYEKTLAVMKFAKVWLARLCLCECRIDCSPTPLHALNAQPSNLAPIALPVHLEFTAPADFTPMETGRARRGAEACLAQLPVTYLPANYQRIFNFRHFNKAQSVAFRDLYHSDKNVVVTAPTGAGKTTLFELAFLHMLNSDPDGKAVYLAPMKALCSERFHDWKRRLSLINCEVLLMTSDTKLKLSEAQAARLIIATPEKWDRMTRRARSNDRVMSCLRLFLIDEVHIIREMRRGATMEVLVARMKAYSSGIRFVAVSATIPNASDFALWIGKRDNEPRVITGKEEEQDNEAAQLYTFSEAFRPCPLTKYIYGLKNIRKDPYAFDRDLNTKLPEIIEEHSKNKGAIVFCPTRKMASGSARHLAKIYSEKQQQTNAKLPWTISPNRPDSIDTEDSFLQEMYMYGIGFHHAGLTMDDRRTIESAFLQGHLNILCCTSSLAVGVNLPAFLVVIRGTQMFDDKEWRDYRDLDVFQMMGRAGRPQFDTEGVAVIMTEETHRDKWTELLKGETTVESTLHHTLIEHANAEIVVRQSCSVRDLQAWLRQTFFFVRLSQKPEYYKLPGCEEVEDADEALYVTSHRIMAELNENELIEDYNKDNDEQQVISSSFGVLMANYSLRFETMQELLKVPRSSSVEKLIEIISKAKEFDRVLLRSGEKGLYESVRQYEGIRFPPSGINDVSDKVSIIFQAQLAGMALGPMLRREGQMISVNPKADIAAIMEHAPNVTRALLSIAVEKQDGGTARSAFELLRCTSGCAWEKTQAELQQITGIGPAHMETLGEAGIRTVEDLGRTKPERLTLLLGQIGLNQAKKFVREARRYPRFVLQVKESMGRIIEGTGVECLIDVSVEMNHSKTDLKKVLLTQADGQPHGVAMLIMTTDPKSRTCMWTRGPVSNLIQGTELPTQKILLKSPDEQVVVTLACDTLSGGVQETRVRSSCPRHKFPVVEVVEDSETESMTSSISELKEREVPQLSKAEAPPKKRQVQEEASSSRSIGSQILRELQQVDACIGPRQREVLMPVLDKPPEKKNPVKAKPVKTPGKRAVKTAETKRQEIEEHKKDMDGVLAKIERIKQREVAEKKAAKEEKERARQEREKRERGELEREEKEKEEREREKEQRNRARQDKERIEREEAKRAEVATRAMQEETSRYEPDDSDEEPVRIKRKKMKPADWNFRVGADDFGEDEEMEPNVGISLDRYSPENVTYDDEDPTPMDSDLEEQPRKSPRKMVAKSKRVFVVIDETDDEEEEPTNLKKQESDDDDHTYSRYQDATPPEDDLFDEPDMPLDWPQDYYHEEAPISSPAKQTRVETTPLPMFPSESVNIVKQPKTKSRIEGPLFHAPPTSPGTTKTGLSITRDRLIEMEDDPGEFDADYLEELLNAYD